MHPTSTGHEVLRYNVATSSGPRDSPRTSWFRVTSFVPEGPQRDFVLGLEKGYVIPTFPFPFAGEGILGRLTECVCLFVCFKTI